MGARHIDQLKANLDSLDVTLSAELLKRLDDISKPTLNFPAANNETYGPMLGFPGTTVDGRAVPLSTRLTVSASPK